MIIYTLWKVLKRVEERERRRERRMVGKRMILVLM
jgi:membrane protein implicated in regulation of membrane protease activity